MLFICPTPIGNLQDVTLRVLDVLRGADVIACEDTRHTRILLARYELTGARLLSFHGYNEEQRVEALLPLLREGKQVALVSDAGMPGLSDPGFSLVRACIAEGLPFTVLPGPSAISTALVASGIPPDRFVFIGFLERSRGRLVDQIARLDATGLALVAFESPRRIRASLAVLAENWPERQVAVCRELTKIHEEIVRGTPLDVSTRLAEQVKGEIVLVLAPVQQHAGAGLSRAAHRHGAPPPLVAGAAARRALGELLNCGMRTKAAAALVSDLTGIPSRQVYSLALEAKKELQASELPGSKRPEPKKEP
jgi:16S rRNA (cytidine1402-2'-O)-methyltransferase